MSASLANSEVADKRDVSYLRINVTAKSDYRFRMTLNLHIREIRKAKKLTLQQLADMIGVSVPHLSEIERGLKNVNNHLLERLTLALGVPSEALLSSQGSKTSRLNAVASTLDAESLEQLMAFADALKIAAEAQKQKQ